MAVLNRALGAMLTAVVAGAAWVVPATAAEPSVPVTVAATSADRIAGIDRFETAVRVSQQAFPAGASRVFVASGLDYPDALSAAPIAAALGAPLLLIPRHALGQIVVNELQRVAPNEVVIVGGVGVVSGAVEAQLRQLGYAVQRVQGIDRYATSRAIVERFAEPSETLFLVTGRNYPDALAAAAAAGADEAPVLLVDGNRSTVDASTLALVSNRGVRSIVIAGGTAVMSPGIEQQLVGLGYTVNRRAGADRYATAVEINAHSFPSADRAFIATGLGFADALAGAVYAARENAPLFLSPPQCLPRVTQQAIVERLKSARVTLLGGIGVLSSRVAGLDTCSTTDDDRATSEAELTAALQARLRTLAGTYSVSIKQLEGLQANVSIGGGTMQEPVSVIKLFVAYGVLDRIDRGQLSMATITRSGETVQECLRVTIHVSDNYCHWDLVALVGAQALNNQFWAEGYRGTVYAGRSGGGTLYSSKLSTTNDLALLLSRLQRGELLSPALTEHFMALLETQLWRSKLPSGAAVGVPVANKTGSAWTSLGWYHSDAGIVSAPGGAYAIAVLGSRGATSAGVREIGRVVYEHFNGRIGTRGSWSDLNSVTRSAITYYRFGGASTPLGVIPVGTRIETYASSRTWYRVIYQGNYVYVHSSGLRNFFDYPRSAR